MKDVLLLTKILFKNSLNKKGDKSKVGKILIYILVYGYIAGFSAYFSYICVNALIITNQENTFINLCFVGMGLTAVIQTIFSSLNLLFFSKDIENLLPLPIKPIKIVMAKINCLIISTYLMASMIFLPMIITYGILLKCTITFWIATIMTLILVPIVPTMIVTFLMIIIMRFTKIVKNKDIMQYISVALTLILIIVIQFGAGSSGSKNITNEEMAQNIISYNDQISGFSKLFFSLKPAASYIENYNNLNGVKSLVILVVETICTYLFVCFITSKMYIKAVTSFLSLGNKKSKKIDESKDFLENKLWKTYTKKEIKLLVRNPIYLMQCVIPPVLFPFVFSIPLISLINDPNPEELYELENFLLNGQNMVVVFGFLLAIILFLYIFNFTSITAISREGTDAIFMKQIPVGLDKQIEYKILPGIIFNIVPATYVLVLASLMTKCLDLKLISSVFLISLLINICNNYIMILIDLKNPKLNWETEYAVVKQNFNMIFQFIIMIIQCGIIIVMSAFLELDNCIITLALIYIIAIILIRKYIRKKQIQIFMNIK